MLPKDITGPLPATPVVAETLQTHQLAYNFAWEVEYRHEHEQYCRWYEAVAAQHRRELVQMRTELNLLGWLRRRGG